MLVPIGKSGKNSRSFQPRWNWYLTAKVKRATGDDDSDALTELSESFEAQPGSRQRQPWLKSIYIIRSREKLVCVLRGDEALPRNLWGIDRILAILVHHREDKRLKTSYRQFRRFAYYTMMTESKEDGRWQKALGRRELKSMLHTRLQLEVEAQYCKEIQTLCKTPESILDVGIWPGG